MIRLAVVDIDGCLTPGEGRPWDLAALAKVRAYNQGEPPRLPVTVCTGRQQPYLEAFMQAIGARTPGVFEHGCGMYHPIGYRYRAHPAYTDAHARAREHVLRAVRHGLTDRGLGTLVPGKEYIVTVYANAGLPLQSLVDEAAALLAGIDEFQVIQSATCVDILPRGIDKGAGAAWLAEVTEVPLDEMGGIGDSNCDWAFLSVVGESAAPANAQAELRRLAGYVSGGEQVYGVLDILERWSRSGAANE